MSLRMKYPSLNQFIESNFDTEDEAETMVDKTFRVVADCIDILEIVTLISLAIFVWM